MSEIRFFFKLCALWASLKFTESKESFRPGLSLKPGLKPENGFKSYVYQKT
jgi:hypothetical protein